MGDNGELQPKTNEELIKERLERYQKGPELFIEQSEVIVCVKRTPKGNMIMVNGTAIELKIAYTDITRALLKTIDEIEIANKNQIIQPKHGIVDFIRRKR
jgi:hypothetical protein